MKNIRPNEIHRFFHNPQSAWDPVPPAYASAYAQYEWDMLNKPFVGWLEKEVGGFSGKRILDLGGGPGHYSVEFAKRDAYVTWHDISRQYLSIAKQKAADHKVSIEFSLGYLEEAECYVRDPFDIVFNRGCWHYSIDDEQFASLIYRLVKPEGYVYIMTNTAEFYKPVTWLRKLQYFVNNRFSLKFGHPFPPAGRIKDLMGKYPIHILKDEMRKGQSDILFFQTMVSPA